MRLYIVRHGEAERRATTDAERPLTAHGRAQVRHLWHELAEEGVAVARLVASPFLRARQTADEIAAVFPGVAREEQASLVPEGSPAAVINWLLQRPAEEGLVLVSHMPLVGQLTGTLVESGNARVPFSVGSVACLDVEVAASGGARLLWLRAPDARA